MPNFAKVLKDETARIARREANSAVGPAAKAARGLKHTAAQLKRRVAELEKEVRALQKTVGSLNKAQPAAAGAPAEKARITAKGMRSLRRRLRLTGQDFATLLGITPQVVYNWEKANGPLRVRQRTRTAILAVREIGARDARRRLDQMKAAKTKRRNVGKRRKRA
jgi:DNA-binding transcriptional regulator YiaG